MFMALTLETKHHRFLKKTGLIKQLFFLNIILTEKHEKRKKKDSADKEKKDRDNIARQSIIKTYGKHGHLF